MTLYGNTDLPGPVEQLRPGVRERVDLRRRTACKRRAHRKRRTKPIHDRKCGALPHRGVVADLRGDVRRVRHQPAHAVRRGLRALAVAGVRAMIVSTALHSSYGEPLGKCTGRCEDGVSARGAWPASPRSRRRGRTAARPSLSSCASSAPRRPTRPAPRAVRAPSQRAPVRVL